ncbi:MAG: CHAT domain-containing protein [Pirellulaceae bacterium]
MAARSFVFALPAALVVALWAAPAPAQLPRKQAPNETHFASMTPFLDGDFQDAAKGFRNASRSRIIIGGAWIDSICYHAMLGECFYQMGDLDHALEQYNSACELYLAHRDWMARIDFPPSLGPKTNTQSPAITWGASTRNIKLGAFQDRYSSVLVSTTVGAIEGQAVLSQQPVLYPVHVGEIVRCTALALSRRREILGPTCEHDPLTGQLVDALARRPGPPNHWAQCWVELQLGLAYAGANKIPQAATALQSSLLAGGVYEHPLTCVGLLELGKLSLDEGKYDAAIALFHEATISAMFFDRFEVMEEAFRLGALAYMVSGQKGVYPPLVPAAAAARRVEFVQASILTTLADNLITVGDLPAAQAAIAEASKAMVRTDLPQSAVGARLNYQAARAALQAGNAKQGGASLAAAMAFQKKSSKRLYQIALVDRLFGVGGVTERVADLLYADVLREPTRTDWSVDALETLTVSLTPHPLPYEHWFELALARKEQDKAMNIADRIRRHRFYATQPLGGRVLALRWVLEAPKETLSVEAARQRQELLVKYPNYAELSRSAIAAQEQLAALPLVPADDAEIKRQQNLLADLASTSAAQEALLNMMSLERVVAEFAFPPLLEVSDIQAKLPAGTLVFTYLATQRGVHAFALTNDKYGHFSVALPAKVKADVAELLRDMGHYDRTQPVGGEELTKQDWKQPALRLLKQLTNDTKPEDWAKYEEVVIVPDGVLWYLPFEALQVPTDDGSVSLISKVRMRYAPTLSLAVPDGRPAKRIARTAVVAGKLIPREDDALTQYAKDQLGALADVTMLAGNAPAPAGIFSAALDRLVLMADVEDADKAPYGWSPMQLEGGRGGTLGNWIQLPFAGPEQVVFPGFHTPAEVSLKRPGTGDEVFLAICGLMASGSRTALLSRWRVAGQSTVELMREFVQELPHQSAAAAWQRSVSLSIDRVLDPTREPRLKPSSAADGLKASSPFFWSGYMLVDTGVVPAKEAEPVEPAKAAERAKPVKEPEPLKEIAP